MLFVLLAAMIALIKLKELEMTDKPLQYRADWQLDFITDEVIYFYGTRKQCMNKAREISKINDYGAYVVANNGEKDIGEICYYEGKIAYRDGDKI